MVERTERLLEKVLDRLAPHLAEALAGKADRYLVWIDVNPDDDTCVIRLLSPLATMRAEMASTIPCGEVARLAACHPDLAMPIVITGPDGVGRQSWLTLEHEVEQGAFSAN